MKTFLIAACFPLLACAAAGSGCTGGDKADGAPGPLTFASETPNEGATVFLRGKTDASATNRVIVDVVARGAADLHGAAFRVTWDVEALTFVEAHQGAPWSKEVLALAKEGSPGQLAVAWTEKGGKGIDASNETVIGTLVFDAKGRKGTTVAFKTERSLLVDRKGARVEARWLGGSIPAR